MVTPYSSVLLKRSIEHQITYLDGIFKRGYDDELQRRFPEGKVFSNAIFSLSVLDYTAKNAIEDKRYSKIVDRCIGRLFSEYATNKFSENMSPKFGVFYNGWTNYVLYKYKNHHLFQYSTMGKEILKMNDTINKRILSVQLDSMRILDSYPGAIWPADNLIALISMEDINVQNSWLQLIFDASECEADLINHTGNNSSEIRGSSQSLITFCLQEMEYKNVNEYNEAFQQRLVDHYFGVEMVKENVSGTNEMDVDSGPVIFGYGASGTIMNIKTQASLESKGKLTWSMMNTISMPVNIFGTKYYLGKKEPMFDVFMLWASTEL